MARVLVFEVKINGIRGAVTGTESLREAVKGTKKELDSTDFGSKKYEEVQKQLGSLKEIQKQARADTRRAGREFVIQADQGRESYRALNAELVNLRDSFKNLSRAEREGDVGRQLTARIKELDTELKEIDASIGNFQRNVGNYGSALEALGGINFAELATLPGAIQAGAQAARQAAEFVFELTERFRALRGEVQNITGATGPALDEFTARVAAIADTFEATEEEVIASAQRTADVFGISFEDALTKIEEGFVGGSNQSGEFLTLAQEYAPVFDEIGASADQAFNIINRAVTSGIISDQGLATIEEAQLRLRELPQSTLDALGAIGISAEQIRGAIAERGIAGAIADVSERLQDFENDSQEVGVVLADVFGAAGEKAGADFVKSLADIEDATGSVIDETNEYQQQQLRTLEVNQEFTRVQNEVAQQLAGTTSSFSDLGTIIQTRLLEGLLFLIDRVQTFWRALQPVRDALQRLGEALGIVDGAGRATEGTLSVLNGILEAQEALWNFAGQAIGFVIDQITGLVNVGKEVLEFFGILDSEAAAAAAAEEARAAAAKAAADEEIAARERAMNAEEAAREAAERRQRRTEEANAATRQAAKDLDDFKKATDAAAVATDLFAEGSIAALRKEVNELNKSLEGAAPEDVEGILVQALKAEEALEEAQEYRKQLREVLAGDRVEIPVIPRLEDTEGATAAPEFFADQDAIPIDARLEAVEREKLARIEAAREVAETEEEFTRQRQSIELEAERRALQERLRELEAGSIEFLQVEQEIADTTAQINQAKVDELIRQEQQRAAQLREIEQFVFSSINDSLAALSQASQARTDEEVGTLEDRYAREIELAEGNEARQEELRQELADKRADIERQEFQKQKQFRVATALTSLAEGIVNILAAPTTIPDPFGTLFKTFRIGLLTATTATQIAAINKQRPAARGTLVDAIEANLAARRPRGIPVKAGLGTMIGKAIRGATHGDPSGGIPLDIMGVPVLAESGEFVDVDEYGGVAIINKRSRAALSDQLESQAGVVYPGKRQFLSDANSYRGYGIAFAQEGALVRPNIEPILNSTAPVSVAANREITATFDGDEIDQIATQIAVRTATEVRAAMRAGLLDANRRLEREARLEETTGKR